MLKSDVYTRIYTHLTFDLILGLWGISRLGIHPYPSKNTSRYTLSMDAKMYSKMPTDFFFQALDGQLIENSHLFYIIIHFSVQF